MSPKNVLRRGSFAKFQKKNLEVKKEIVIFAMNPVLEIPGLLNLKLKNDEETVIYYDVLPVGHWLCGV